ncbi:hypothetical protein HZR84_00915 [Hyphobacterium sp. CCMP332]|nr:hypothetical protein HZR84_00915 [Hyphobacterium sp. CCMP332]
MKFLHAFLKHLSNRDNGIPLVIINLLLFAAILFFPVKAKVLGDQDFHIEAKSIAAYLHGLNSYNEISITKAPGPVLFYTLPYFLAGKNPSDVRLVNFARVWICVLSTIFLFWAYKSLLRIFSAQISNIFALFVFIIPLHVYYSMGILAEGPAFLSVLLIIIGFIKFQKKEGFWTFVLGLIFLVLSRPNSILCLPIIFSLGLYYWYFKKRPMSGKYLLASVYAGLVIVLITTFVKMLPNERQTLNQETYLAYVIHIGRFQFRTEEFDWRFWDGNNRSDSRDYQNYISSVHALESQIENSNDSKSGVYYDWIIRDLKEHPFMAVKQFFVRIIFGNTLRINSISTDSFSIFGIKGKTVYYAITIALNIINYLILLLALFFIIQKSSWKKYWPLISIILAIWIFNGIVYIEQRYLFPTRPIIYFLASFGFLLLTKKDNEPIAA